MKLYIDVLIKLNIYKLFWFKGILINCFFFKKKVIVIKNLLVVVIKGLCNLKVINGFGSDLKVKVFILYIILNIMKKRSISLNIYIYVFIIFIFNWLRKVMFYRR